MRAVFYHIILFLTTTDFRTYMTRIRGVDPPHFRMTPSDCRSFTTTSTSAGESFNIVAICLTLLFPSTKAKICLCFRGQELITLCSACTIRCGGVFCLANCKRPSGCATWCGGGNHIAQRSAGPPVAKPVVEAQRVSAEVRGPLARDEVRSCAV